MEKDGRVVGEWSPVGDGVFQCRYDPLDVTVGAIIGDEGVVVVDTRGNPAEAEEILRDVAEAFGLPVVAAVNTHAHYDHTFGNEVFAARGIAIYGHWQLPAHFAAYESPRLLAVQRDPEIEPDKEWAEVSLTPPSILVDSALRIQPAGRAIDLILLSPGHTDTDLAVLVPDARVWFLGDVIEESGPPMFGSGSYPIGWPGALRALLSQIQPADVVVPGHGSPVTRGFVEDQAARLQSVADEIVAQYRPDRSPEDVRLSPVLQEFWPESFLHSAVRAGFAELSRRTPNS